MTTAQRKPAPDQRHAVYRTYDAEDNPVYYGRSGNPFARLATHANTDSGREWIDLVARIEIDWHPTFADAARAERELILRDEPGFARQGVTIPWPEPKHYREPVHLPRDRPAPESEREALPIDHAAVILRVMARMDLAERAPRTDYAGSVPLSRTVILRKALSTLPKWRRRGTGPKLRAALDTLANTPRSRVLPDPLPPDADPNGPPRTYRYLELIGETEDPNL